MRTLTEQRARPAQQIEVLRDGLPGFMLTAQEAIEQGRLAEAGDLLDERAERQLKDLMDTVPPRTDAMLMMGLMLFRIHEYERALDWFKRVTDHTPHALAHQQLACIYEKKGHYTEATDHRLFALALDPENRSLWSDVGMDLMREGRLTEGLDWLYRALAYDPSDSEALAKLFFYLHYLPQPDRRELVALFQQWRQLSLGPAREPRWDRRDMTPDRRLRIGYLSGDLRRHSVAYTFEAIMTQHDPQAVEVFAYSNTARRDAVTERIARSVHCFRDVVHHDTQQLVELIEQDRIDILIFLGGGTDDHRRDVGVHKPAPIQVDWGNICGPEIAQIDYCVTDPLLDRGLDPAQGFDRRVSLDNGFVCYRPPDFAPPVSPLPVQQTGVITFGSCNNSLKINPEVIGLWAQVLKANPDARLLLKFAGGHCPRIQQRFLNQFAQAGVSPERIEINGWNSAKGHLDTYSRIDIALDTFPFNGHVTTLEALWMGVPVIALQGPPRIGSESKAAFARMGLTALLASSPAEYVTRATALAANIPALARMRAGLRACLAASSLCDAGLHAREFEQAYRWMWQQYCAQQKSPAPEAPDDARPEDLLEFYISEQGALRYTVDKRGLPPVLLQAAQIIQAGDVVQGKALLDETVLAAVEAFVQVQPERVDALFMVAVLLKCIEDFERAQQCFERLLAHQTHALIHFELAGLCRDRGKLGAAVDHMERALALAPDSPELKATLADYLIRAGQQPQGVDLLREVVDSSGDIVSHSKYLWHLHQLPELDRQALYQAHCQWSQRYAPQSRARSDHRRERSLDRPLRIGYISGDFCSHSVAYFFEALLDEHARTQVTVWGYGNCPHQDSVTERIKDKLDHHRNVCGVSDEKVVEWIEQDQIDILVDLSGHTGENRLGVLAYKPAPVQVSYLGYPDTTGMPQVDYRFTDQWADEPGAQRYYTEKLLSLDSGFICYRPPEFAPAVGPLPAQSRGHVTFGSFNNSGKINARVIGLWARVLQALPTARLLLKFGGGDDERVRSIFLQQFQALGIGAERIRLIGRLAVVEHLDLYNQVDLALDSFPYHGTTTTCEALWMGVPTISLVGQHHVSRVGLSLLSRVGLEVFTAGSEQEYVAKAVSFAQQTEHLSVLRQALRTRVGQSPLCDKRAYAKCVEAAYQHMWRHWCQAQERRKG